MYLVATLEFSLFLCQFFSVDENARPSIDDFVLDVIGQRFDERYYLFIFCTRLSTMKGKDRSQSVALLATVALRPLTCNQTPATSISNRAVLRIGKVARGGVMTLKAVVAVSCISNTLAIVEIPSIEASFG
jgi:hypothetical protein